MHLDYHTVFNLDVDTNNLACAAITVIFTSDSKICYETFYIKPQNANNFNDCDGLVVFESTPSVKKFFPRYTDIEEPELQDNYYQYNYNDKVFYEQSDCVKQINFHNFKAHFTQVLDKENRYIKKFTGQQVIVETPYRNFKQYIEPLEKTNNCNNILDFHSTNSNDIKMSIDNFSTSITPKNPDLFSRIHHLQGVQKTLYNLTDFMREGSRLKKDLFHSEQRLAMHLKNSLINKAAFINYLSSDTKDHLKESQHPIGFFLHLYSTQSPCLNCAYLLNNSIRTFFKHLVKEKVYFLGTLGMYDRQYKANEIKPHTINYEQVPWFNKVTNSLGQLIKSLHIENNIKKSLKHYFYGQHNNYKAD